MKMYWSNMGLGSKAPDIMEETDPSEVFPWLRKDPDGQV